MHAIANQCLKVPAAMLAAAAVTTTLFFLMHLMVYSDEERVQEAFVIPIVDATMPEIAPPVVETIDRPEPIMEPPPVETDDLVRDPEIGSGPTVSYYNEPFDLDPPDFKTVTFQNAEMVPIVRTTPVYPTRALQRRMEGFVVVSFTVDERGNVVDPSVIYAEPEGYFERAALQSIAKWRYSARVKDGQPIPVHDVQQRIVFQIAE